MKKMLLSIALLSIVSGSVIADDKNVMDHSNMDHAAHMAKMMKSATANQAPSPVPTEAGQAGFAAIAEIVQILSSNPNTDWSKVNINALREHLLDMDRLVTGAKVSEEAVKGGMRFNATGTGDVLKAIQHMVPAHAAELEKMSEYTATTEVIESGIALIVTTEKEAIVAKIKGLGFFGLMASGSHHQPHHFGMATGQMDHGSH